MTRVKEVAHEIIDLVEIRIREAHKDIETKASKLEGNTLLFGAPYYSLEDEIAEELRKFVVEWKRQKLYAVIGVWSGCLHDVKVFIEPEKALQQRNLMAEEYDLTEADIPDNQHSKECRWNDENEVHLHELQLKEHSHYE